MNVYTDTLNAVPFVGIVTIGCLVFLEVLQSFNNNGNYALTRDQLAKFDQYLIFNNTMLEPCAENHRVLCKKEIAIHKTNDVIIAAYYIEHQLPLFYADRDFDPFTDYLGLIPIC